VILLPLPARLGTAEDLIKQHEQFFEAALVISNEYDITKGTSTFSIAGILKVGRVKGHTMDILTDHCEFNMSSDCCHAWDEGVEGQRSPCRWFDCCGGPLSSRYRIIPVQSCIYIYTILLK
jgi:hypothetical protein